MDGSLKSKVIIGFAVVAVAVCLYALVGSFGEDPAVRSANTITLMCAETGGLFDVELKEDMPPYPHQNPRTGRMTLYPTEVCWRGECGQRGGTHVILNTWLDKEGPTRCPVCGSIVRVHNPGPEQPPEED